MPVKREFLEQTGAQISALAGVSDVLYQTMPATYATYRDMRKDPTIALARALLAAVVLTGEWSIEVSGEDEEKKKEEEAPPPMPEEGVIEGEPVEEEPEEETSEEDERVKFITDEVLTKRKVIIEAAVNGSVDFGWAPFELVYEKREDGKVGLKKIKPLLQDITTILIEPSNGDFRGYRQRNPNGENVDLIRETCLHVGFRVEGTNWYGSPLLENARYSYNNWLEANKGAARYDKKLAGSHFVIYYPIGKTIYNGALTDNSDIAKALLLALESSGSVSIPDELREFEATQNGEKPRWRIEILEDKGSRQPGFIERLRYLDAQKVRALLMPERSILEGQFGTKAEAGVHADMAILNIELLDRIIADEVNKQVVDNLLLLNFGPDAVGSVRIEPAPIVDDQLIMLKGLYDKIMTNAQGFAEEFPTIDTDAMKDKLGVPKRREIAPAGLEGLLPPPSTLPPPKPTEEEEKKIEAGFVPRTERGRWTYDGAGLADYYGADLAPADQAFTNARKLANEGKFDAARKALFSIKRPRDDRAHFAVQRRMSQMLERFLRIEYRMKSARPKAIAANLPNP